MAALLASTLLALVPAGAGSPPVVPAPAAYATPAEIRFGNCVAQHESRHQPKAKNPTSSAAGLFQHLKAHWEGNAKWAKWGKHYPARKYATADKAPARIQWLVFIHSVRHGGFRAWQGTNCTWKGHQL